MLNMTGICSDLGLLYEICALHSDMKQVIDSGVGGPQNALFAKKARLAVEKITSPSLSTIHFFGENCQVKSMVLRFFWQMGDLFF